MKYYGCVDLGGTTLRMAYVSEEGIITEKVVIEISAFAFDREALISSISQGLNELIHGNDIYHSVEWTVAVPCVVNENSFSHASNLTKSLSPKDFQTIFMEAGINTPITFINDVHAASMAELGYGKLKGIKNALYLNIGTGLSCVVIIDGKIHRGHNNAAGEIAFWQDSSDSYSVKPGYPYLEKSFSGKSLERKLHDHYRESGVDSLSCENLESLLEIGLGNNKVKAILERHFSKLAVHFYNMAILLDPQKIVLGGGVSVLKDDIAPVFRACFKNLIHPPKFSFVDNPQDSGLKGCVYYALSKEKIHG